MQWPFVPWPNCVRVAFYPGAKFIIIKAFAIGLYKKIKTTYASYAEHVSGT